MPRLVHDFCRRATHFLPAGLDLLFPPRCEFCDADLSLGGHDVLLCSTCQARLGPESWNGCPRCAAIGTGDGGAKGRCGLCRKYPLKFGVAITLGSYQKELRDVVLRMKRRESEPLSAAMGRLLAIRRAGLLSSLDADLILPVPMYWARKLARGTNSPEIVAGRLADGMRIPVSYRILRRKRNTLPQKDLPTGQRFRNVRGAFAVRRNHDLQGARVVLVDDILTTGATCSEAAGVLKKAGAAMVAAVVIARAEGPNAT